MSQTVLLPSNRSRQTMSGFPSLLKSPVAAMFQLNWLRVVSQPTLPLKAVPSMNHATFEFLAGSRHRISSKPSPLKSPVPAILKAGDPVMTGIRSMRSTRLINQISFSAVDSELRNKSSWPSLLKSAVAATRHPSGKSSVMIAAVVNFVRSKNQAATSPVVSLCQMMSE